MRPLGLNGYQRRPVKPMAYEGIELGEKEVHATIVPRLHASLNDAHRCCHGRGLHCRILELEPVPPASKPESRAAHLRHRVPHRLHADRRDHRRVDRRGDGGVHGGGGVPHGSRVCWRAPSATMAALYFSQISPAPVRRLVRASAPVPECLWWTAASTRPESTEPTSRPGGP
eukprot:CAMPEP_0182553382 /NCGR_PEP_ID=MMETSP1323-20130603/49454_1 /TAXON_ID=236787 /ORGANISM="Florenciella parvula, Strain RCC1693" /LENGTH=171 /DNA_ID=CAMNT_0024765097 /DNA_START=116 /DNA_END=632 /DNA_ORIENTATION=+